jgi:hypothetical protein
MELYPNYTMIFLTFNLLGWWYKDVPFFSWYWFILIRIMEIFMHTLTLAITKKVLAINR